MLQRIDNKIIARIYGRGKGWAFTKIDFVAGFGDVNIYKALSNLAQAGKIRRVCHGVYDYPRQRILKDTRSVTGWIYQIIKQAYSADNF
jgi:hypothetical protein